MPPSPFEPLRLNPVELMVAWLDGWAFAREHDAATGHAELTLRRIS